MTIEELRKRLNERADEVWQGARAKFYQAVQCELGMCPEEKTLRQRMQACGDPEEKPKIEAKLAAFHAERVQPWSDSLDEMKRLYIAAEKIKELL